MTPLAWTYAAYLTASGVITVWFGQTLHHHGRVLLIDTFHGNTRIADAVNHLLLVGFYLVNLAFVTLTLKSGLQVTGFQDGLEVLAQKLGLIMTVLGVWHFKNMLICHYVRGYWKRRLADHFSHPARVHS
ncbi:hypothetical protein GC163_09590 [bacterium]|nr:hypothetical protein [bacterium]